MIAAVICQNLLFEAVIMLQAHACVVQYYKFRYRYKADTLFYQRVADIVVIMFQ